MAIFQLSRIEKKYWRPAIVETVDGETIDCLIDSEGHCYRFKLSDVESILLQYPRRNKCWYFNETFDREIAEVNAHCSAEVVVNPQFVAKNFLSYAF